MKIALVAAALLVVAPMISLAGGNTSVVNLDKISSIKIEDEKITIVGSGMLRKRVLSDAEHGDGSVFGQPAQYLHAKVIDCVFEIVPYHVRSDLKGVPGPDPENMTPEMLAQSQEWWAGTVARAKEIKVGDAVTIGYQREKMTLVSVYVAHVVGSGSVRKS